jgi:hypothetical protein
MAFQNAKSPNFGNFGTPKLGVPRQNDIWMQLLWLVTENTIRGEGGGFLQIWAMVSMHVVNLVSPCMPVVNLVTLCMPVVNPYTKTALTTH